MEKIERNMKQFTATKTVKAIPMTRTDAEKFLGRSITPADPKAEEGYLLLYPDGYYSWSPKEVFEKAYRLSESFIDRLHIEEAELRHRIEALHSFILTNKYRDMPREEKVMLSSQFTAMHTYYNALATRLDFYLKF